jgi:iron complex outermembrane receptor protein
MKSSNVNVRSAVRFALAACAATAACQGAIAAAPALDKGSTDGHTAKAVARSTSKAPLLLAQNVPAPSAASATPATLQTVVVTGSLIALPPNAVSVSPITSVSQAAMVKVGVVRLEDEMQNLPQFAQGMNSGESIGSNGTASLNLYGLGARRTLVLINGRRMGPGGGRAGEPDINQIPAALVSQVQVLTGGASTTYGADAVAGVVNFIINTHFTGVKIDGSYSFNQHSNDDPYTLGLLQSFGAPTPPSEVNTGQNRDISIIMGSNFAGGKGNATGYFTFTRSSPSVGSQFDHAGCTINGGSSKTGPLHCGGSLSDATGSFFETGILPGATHSTGLVADTINPKTGLMQPYSSADLYNYGAVSYFQVGLKRYTAGAFVHYNINGNTQAYSETMLEDISTTAQYGPSADFFSAANISCADPLLTAQEKSVLCSPTNYTANQAAYPATPAGSVHIYIGRRDVEGGPRVDKYVSDDFREVLGVKGAIGEAWSYDTWAMVSNSSLSEYHNNNLGQPQILNALDVVPNVPVNSGGEPGVPVGAPVCASEINRPPGLPGPHCVPWNIWVPGGVTQQQLNYLIIPNIRNTTAREYMLQSTFNGDLGQYGLKLPTADSGVKVAAGFDWREDYIDFQPDLAAQYGLTSGDGPSPPEYGNFNLWEGFTEARIPLLSHKPLARKLTADVGYRYSKYNLGFTTNTYEGSLAWSPIRPFLVRGGYNRAVRAPNIDELFSSNSIGPGGVADPCWGTTPSLTLAQCELTGVTAAQYGHLAVNPAAQINNEGGGNTKLLPEIADTYYLGLVFRPTQIPSLYASVDYYNISVRNTIEALSTSTVLDGCATGTTAFCSLIHRGSNGSLWENEQTDYVVTTDQNIGKLRTSGVGVTAQYGIHMGRLGRVNLALQGNYVHDLLTQSTPNMNSSYDCVGYYGATCGAPVPHWRHVLTAGWETPWMHLGFQVRWRYIGASSNDGLSSNPNLSGDGYYTVADQIPSYNYFDLSAFMPVIKNVTLTVGVNNIADKNPPLVPSGSFSACPTVGCNDNTWVGVYDTMGRFIFANVEAKFD